ncbi:MAG: hypothetical protein OIF50_16970 [Flavobacteriaceae bacterium]|nr:hypothetical protein [Flavobacteriaceae bacterium]
MRTLVLFSIIILSIGCKKTKPFAQKNRKPTAMIINDSMQKTRYYLDYRLPGSVSMELCVNDVKLRKSFLSGYIDLNPYILKSGIQNVKIRAYCLEGTLNIEPYHTKQFPNELPPIRVSIYTTDEKEENIHKLVQFPLTPIDKPIPLYEASWEFEAEVPYELEGWSKAQDLSKWDQEVLLEKVVAKYQEYREMLHSGNTQAFWKAIDKGLQEEFVSYYYTEERIQQLYARTNFYDLQKDIMMPLEKYTMKLYGNGRLVCLENIDKEEYVVGTTLQESIYHLGQSSLFSYREIPLKSDNISFYYNRIYLMMPVGSEELEIIRLIQSIG